jgi:hypothetical protein
VNGTLDLDTGVTGGNSGTITVGSTGAIMEKFAPASTWYWQTGTAKVVVNGGATWTIHPASDDIVKVGTNGLMQLASGAVLTLTEQPSQNGNDFLLVGNASVKTSVIGGDFVLRTFTVGDGSTASVVTLLDGKVTGKSDCTFSSDPSGLTNATGNGASGIIFKKGAKVVIDSGATSTGNNFYATGGSQVAVPDNSSGQADVVYRWSTDKWVVGAL